MAANHPTLINLPPPPSDPVTPSDVPGTPNSAVTSMSELSTVAIKDGHRGHLPHHRAPSDPDPLRADRISRLAGLERVATARPNPYTSSSYNAAQGQGALPPTTQAYFDSNNQPQIMRERSTVGSASATGSVGGRTTWASGSDVYDPDKMSEDQEYGETSSVGGFSDEAASLVGFGEGARTPARQQSSVGSPLLGKATLNQAAAAGQGQPTGASAVPQNLRDQAGNLMTGISSPGSAQTTSSTEAQRQDARMIDGMTYDEGILDTSARTPPLDRDIRVGETASERPDSSGFERKQ